MNEWEQDFRSYNELAMERMARVESEREKLAREWGRKQRRKTVAAIGLVSVLGLLAVGICCAGIPAATYYSDRYECLRVR